MLCKRQLPVLRLIESKYLSDKFWADPGRNCEHELKRQMEKLMPQFGTPHMLPVLTTLFERIYVMRLQVFHGAATKGSSLNRRTLAQCTGLLREFLPAMIDVMMRYGVETDWGPVCFPPIK